MDQKEQFDGATMRADKMDKIIEDLKGIVATLDPEGKIKVSRSEALEWWDKARIANKGQRGMADRQPKGG